MISRFFIILTLLSILTGCALQPKTKIESPTVEKSNLSTQNIAVILPFKSKYQNIANNIKNAVRMSIHEHKEVLKEKKVRVRYYDEEDPELANKIKNNNIKYTIGPLFGIHGQKLAQSLPEVKFYSLSNDRTLAKDNLYITGISPHQVIETIITQANLHNIQQIYLIGNHNRTNLELIEFINTQLRQYPDLVMVKIELYNNTSQGLEFGTHSMSESLKAIDEKTKGLLITLESKEQKLEEIIEGLRTNNVDFTKFDIYCPYLINVDTLDDSNPFIADLYVALLKNNEINARYNEQFKTKPENISIVGYNLMAEIIDLSDNKTIENSNFIIDSHNPNLIKRKIELRQLKDKNTVNDEVTESIPQQNETKEIEQVTLNSETN